MNKLMIFETRNEFENFITNNTGLPFEEALNVSNNGVYGSVVLIKDTGEIYADNKLQDPNTSGDSNHNNYATKDELNLKQDVISDLDTIRAGAAKGATALQEHQSLDAYAKITDVPMRISDLDNDAGSISFLGIEYTLSDSDKVVSNVNEWAATSTPLTQRERAIVYGNGYYVICGTSGDVAYSTDANEWTKITPFTTGVLTSIAYGKGRFLAIDSLGAVWISYKNPYSWEQVDVTFDVILEAVIYANNRFIIVGASGLFAKSNNGLTWEVGNIDSVDKYSLTFGKGKYIAVGLNGSIFESTDGETWIDNSDPAFTQSIRTTAYGNGLFVCGGQNGAIRYSADGKVWTTATTNSTSTISYIRGIAYSNGRFYACMYTSAGNGEIWVSDDAATWTVQFTSNGRLWAIVANDNILLSTGDNGATYKLDLAVEWQDSEPEAVEGKYLWQRVYAGLTDGSTVYGENVRLINSITFAANDLSLEVQTNELVTSKAISNLYSKIENVNVGVGNIDLTSYATKDYVNDTISERITLALNTEI